jgi:hypothetical protein
MKAKFIKEPMKNLEDFKNKYQDLIDKGVIIFDTFRDNDVVIINRFDGENFLVSAKELAEPRIDIKKLGFTLRYDIGTYMRKKEKNEEKPDISKEEIKSSNQMTHFVNRLINKNDVDGLIELFKSNPKYSVDIRYILEVILDEPGISDKIKKIIAKQYRDKIITYILQNHSYSDKSFNEICRKLKPYLPKVPQE